MRIISKRERMSFENQQKYVDVFLNTYKHKFSFIKTGVKERSGVKIPYVRILLSYLANGLVEIEFESEKHALISLWSVTPKERITLTHQEYPDLYLKGRFTQHHDPSDNHRSLSNDEHYLLCTIFDCIRYFMKPNSIKFMLED